MYFCILFLSGNSEMNVSERTALFLILTKCLAMNCVSNCLGEEKEKKKKTQTHMRNKSFAICL